MLTEWGSLYHKGSSFFWGRGPTSNFTFAKFMYTLNLESKYKWKTSLNSSNVIFLFLALKEIKIYSWKANLFCCCCSLQLFHIFPIALLCLLHPSPLPHSILPPTVVFAHGSFITVPWWPFSFFSQLSPLPLPSGYCQFVLNFNVSGYILLAYLFCWLGSTYTWDHMVFIFHHLAYFT